MASMTLLVRITKPTKVYAPANCSLHFFTVKFIADVSISSDDLGNTSLSIAPRLESPVMHDLSLFVQELSVYAI